MEVPWRDIKVSSGEPRHTITVSTPVLAYCYVTASPKYRARAFPPRSSFMTCFLTATLVLPVSVSGGIIHVLYRCILKRIALCTSLFFFPLATYSNVRDRLLRYSSDKFITDMRVIDLTQRFDSFFLLYFSFFFPHSHAEHGHHDIQ